MNRISHSLSTRRLQRTYVYLSAIAILTGSVIYILFRTSEPIFFSWIRAVGLGHWLHTARDFAQLQYIDLPPWMIYSLPNGLWAFAYATIITGIWSGSRSWLKYIWLTSIPLLVVGFELMQYPGIIYGTFCMQDLIFGIAGMFIGIMIMSNLLKHKNHE